MRVTLVCPYDPIPERNDTGKAVVGGVERVYDEVSRALAQHGHDVTLVCSTDGAPGLSRKNGIDVVRERRRLTVLRAPVCDLSRHLRRDTDVVQVAATYPFTTPRVLRKARRLGVPSVLDFHFEPAPGSTVGRWAAAAYRRLGPRHYPLAHATFVRSQAYARSAPSLRLVPTERLHVVPNGIDPTRFHPHGPVAEGEYLLFVGRLVPYKGLEVLLAALASLRLPYPLYVVGDGPLRAQLEAQARFLRVDVRWLGHVADSDLPKLYRGAKLTVLPSVNRQEAFGIALVESMACGTPVVASALPGVEEVARAGGLVAPPGDAEALADQVRAALEGGLERGPRLAQRIHRTYSWDAVVRRMEGVYERVAGPAPAVEEAALAHPGGRTVL